MTKPRLVVLLVLAVLLLVLVVVGQFPPAHGTFYPSCLSRNLTGFYCPGCGMGRAVHDLLHLRFTAAFGHNPLFVLLLPLLIYWSGNLVWSVWRDNRWPAAQPPGWAVKLLLAVLVGYFVARNLPGKSFAWLRPLKRLCPIKRD